MQFALVDGARTTAAPQLVGTCPACRSQVVARCGTIRVHHWAHRGERNCDPWWERETQWHRNWKNHFAAECQEVVLFDGVTGEKHIADVKTGHGLVVEFQHSHLRPDERLSREKFYKNIVWVVDGARLKGDLPRFIDGRQSFRHAGKRVSVCSSPERAFPKIWLNCNTPVFFDFHDGLDEAAREGPLHCLLPGRAYGHAVIVAVQRHEFVHLAGSGPELFPVRNMMKDIGDALMAEERAWLAAERARLIQEARNRSWIALSTARFQYRSKAPRRRRL